MPDTFGGRYHWTKRLPGAGMVSYWIWVGGTWNQRGWVSIAGSAGFQDFSKFVCSLFLGRFEAIFVDEYVFKGGKWAQPDTVGISYFLKNPVSQVYKPPKTNILSDPKALKMREFQGFIPFFLKNNPTPNNITLIIWLMFMILSSPEAMMGFQVRFISKGEGSDWSKGFHHHRGVSWWRLEDFWQKPWIRQETWNIGRIQNELSLKNLKNCNIFISILLCDWRNRWFFFEIWCWWAFIKI